MEQEYQKRIDVVRMMLEELGQAYRGSWKDVDGRTIKREMTYISDCLDINNKLVSIHNFREEWDLCPAGDGHWTEFCDEYCVGG